MTSLVTGSQACPRCGTVEAAGGYCSLCLLSASEFDSGHISPTPAGEWPEGSYQRCLKCGTDEYAGGFCSWCLNQTYDLIQHRHMTEGGKCPLGPYISPAGKDNQTPGEIKRHATRLAQWNATRGPDFAAPYIIRRWRHERMGA